MRRRWNGDAALPKTWIGHRLGWPFGDGVPAHFASAMPEMQAGVAMLLNLDDRARCNLVRVNLQQTVFKAHHPIVPYRPPMLQTKLGIVSTQ